MDIFQKPFLYYKKHGFTLIEVLMVILIAVLVTLFSVPAYKKMQERNAYMKVSALVTDLGNGVLLTKERFPNVNLSLKSITSAHATESALTDDALNSTPDANNLINWLRGNKYIHNFPTSGKELGYSFSISTSGNACAVLSWSGSSSSAPSVCGTANLAIVCAYKSSATLDTHKCVWVDFSGNLNNN